jgi:Ca2+-binding EF-hand superfamily protein
MAFAILLAGTTFAAAQSALDTDGDGMVSLAEVQAMAADFTEEQFAAIDTNADGMLDEAELAAAVEAGVIPAE